MEPNGKYLVEVQRAIMNALETRELREIFLALFDERLRNVVAENTNHPETVEKAIEWCVTKDRLDDFILASHKKIETNMDLLSLVPPVQQARCRLLAHVLDEGRSIDDNLTFQKTYQELLDLVSPILAPESPEQLDQSQLVTRFQEQECFWDDMLILKAKKIKGVLDAGVAQHIRSNILWDHTSPSRRARHPALPHVDRANDWKALHEEYQQISIIIIELRRTLSLLDFPFSPDNQDESMTAASRDFSVAWIGPRRGRDNAPAPGASQLIREQRARGRILDRGVERTIREHLAVTNYLTELNEARNGMDNIVQGLSDFDTLEGALRNAQKNLYALEYSCGMLLSFFDDQLKSTLLRIGNSLAIYTQAA